MVEVSGLLNADVDNTSSFIGVDEGTSFRGSGDAKSVAVREP